MTDALTFEAWPKTPRLNRDIIVTEKIDGTNGAIIIDGPHPYGWHVDNPPAGTVVVATGIDPAGNPDHEFVVGAQSRNRLVSPGKATDHFGFAAWVHEHAVELVYTLGAGRHFGEWFGRGIMRGYNLDHKRFALFNTSRARTLIDTARSEGIVVPGLDTTPVLYHGPFGQAHIEAAVEELRLNGSKVSSGHSPFPAEGVCVFHTQSRQVYKVLLENDDIPKSLVAA